MSSLKMNLIASARGWSRPSGPTRSGPMRPCIHALRRRSTLNIPGVRPKTKKPRTNASFRTSGSPIGLDTLVADLSVVGAGHRLAEHALDRDHGRTGAERHERLLQPLRLGPRGHRRLDRLADPLDAALEVHERAVLLRPRGAGQDDVGRLDERPLEQ